MNRLTERQAVKHSDGTSHIETYCFWHRWGPAAFPSKWGGGDPQEYEDYCAMVERIAVYEDTGLEPEEIVKLNTFEGSELERMLEKLQSMTAERDELRKAFALAEKVLERWRGSRGNGNANPDSFQSNGCRISKAMDR